MCLWTSCADTHPDTHTVALSCFANLLVFTGRHCLALAAGQHFTVLHCHYVIHGVPRRGIARLLKEDFVDQFPFLFSKSRVSLRASQTDRICLSRHEEIRKTSTRTSSRDAPCSTGFGPQESAMPVDMGGDGAISAMPVSEQIGATELDINTVTVLRSI